MLATLLTNHYKHLKTLADSWLESGATAFGIWTTEGLLEQWTTTSEPILPFLSAPIQVRDTILGELRVNGVNTPAAQSRLTAEAELIARLAGLETELEMMAEELIDSQDQLLAFYDLMRSTHKYLQLEETLQSLIREVARLSKVQCAFIGLASSVGIPTLVQYPTLFLDEKTLTRLLQLAQDGNRELLINDHTHTQDIPSLVENLFFVPIQIRGAVIAGGLGLVNKYGGHFTSPDIKLARAIAEQTGVLIEKALLYQESIAQARLQTEMELARQVQLLLLPQHAPNVPGLDIFAASRPASLVGGDFYDFITHPNRPFIFTLGDVTGKGMSAALMMTMTRTVIRGKTNFIPQPTPVVIMHRSNEELYNDFTEVSMFATVFIGQYQLHEQQIIYANAGHAPVIYRPKDKPARLLEADGMPIGVLPQSSCAHQAISFTSGDVLVVATDGFSEASNMAGELFGNERLIKLIESYADLSGETLAHTLFSAIEEFSAHRSQDDDQTLIVIKGR